MRARGASIISAHLMHIANFIVYRRQKYTRGSEICAEKSTAMKLEASVDLEEQPGTSEGNGEMRLSEKVML